MMFEMKDYRINRMEAETSVEEFLQECVDVDKFLGYCRQCGNYNKSWACPPFDFDPVEYWKQFHTVHLMGFKIHLPEDLRGKSCTEEEKSALYEMILMDWKKKFDQEMLIMEEKYEGGRALSGGSCLLCESGSCTKLIGEPCRFPQKMRHSIEALGGDVSKTVEKYFGEQIQWVKDGKLPDYFMLVGGVLE